MKNWITFVAALLVLSGCTTYDQMSPEERRVFLEKEGVKCESFGYRRGTDAFAQCLHLAAIRHDDEVKERFQEIGDSLERTGDNIAATRRPVRCTSRSSVYSNTVRTTCY